MSQLSLNLTARDFDAYLAEKATSNAYSRPRLEVKQRALGWARRVLARLSSLAIALEVQGSDEHPSLRNKKRVDCQWIFFSREQDKRGHVDRLLDEGRSISEAIDAPSPYTRHAFLALRIDAHAVEVCFAVHPDARVDIDNLQAVLGIAGALPDEALAPEPPSIAVEFVGALHRLPEEFMIGTTPEDRVPAAAATLEAVREVLARAAAGKVALWIGWSVPRDVAIEHAAILDEQLEDALVALAPIYRLVAWSPENDHIALESQLEKIEQARARTHAEVEAQTEKWKAEQAAARERSIEQARARSEEVARNRALPAAALPRPGPAAGPTLATLFRPHSGRSGGAQADRPAGSPPPEASMSVVQSSTDLSARPLALAGPTIEKGTRVRVLSGAFADKVGLVSELDGRGGARVLLGLLSTRLDLTDLEPVVEGRERPSLQSSHRRPVAPMPRKAR